MLVRESISQFVRGGDPGKTLRVGKYSPDLLSKQEKEYLDNFFNYYLDHRFYPAQPKITMEEVIPFWVDFKDDLISKLCPGILFLPFDNFRDYVLLRKGIPWEELISGKWLAKNLKGIPVPEYYFEQLIQKYEAKNGIMKALQLLYLDKQKEKGPADSSTAFFRSRYLGAKKTQDQDRRDLTAILRSNPHLLKLYDLKLRRK